MLKRCSLMLAVLIAAQSMAITIDSYNTVYDANQLPNLFTLGGGVKVIESKGIGTKSESILDIGDGVWEAGSGQPAHGTYLQNINGKYSARQEAKSSIEFRMKVSDWAVDVPVFQIIIGDNTSSQWKVRGFLFGPDYVVERSGGGVAQGTPVTFDTSTDFVTYKMEYSTSTKVADLYYHNGTNWVFLISSAIGSDYTYGVFDLFRIGQDSDDYAGYFQFDYIAWNQVAPNDCAEVFAKGFGNPMDVNQDCYVDLQDFTQLAASWLFCNDPDDEECLQY